jgi:hypothetical protein
MRSITVKIYMDFPGPADCEQRVRTAVGMRELANPLITAPMEMARPMIAAARKRIHHLLRRPGKKRSKAERYRLGYVGCLQGLLNFLWSEGEI